MCNKEISGHKVSVYDSIDELPMVRFHKYQKYLMIDSGVGSDLRSFDERAERIRRFLINNEPDKAVQEMNNLRQCVYLIQTEINPKHLAFATLVKEIDGVPQDDLTDEGIKRVLNTLAEGTNGEVADITEAAKKKIDEELTIYFPKLFEDSEIKEYFNLLRARALKILQNIIAGRNPEDIETEKLTTKLITYSKPKNYAGSDGVEVQYDRQFENLCLSLSEQLHVNPKGFTVKEFYNAFDFLNERARQANKKR